LAAKSVPKLRSPQGRGRGRGGEGWEGKVGEGGGEVVYYI